jgi:hypothetical protein
MSSMCQHANAPRWLPLGLPDQPEAYRCSLCTPPPSAAMVAKWHSSHLADIDQRQQPASSGGQGSEPTPPYTLTIHTPAHPCPHCRSRIITEHYPSASAQPHIRCWSCKRDLTGLVPSTHDWGQSGAIGTDINLTSASEVVV